MSGPIESYGRFGNPTLWGQSGHVPDYFAGLGASLDAQLRYEKDGTIAGYVETQALLKLTERESILWFPAHDDDLRLQWIGYSSNIERFFGEGGASYESRLALKWDTWEVCGTELAIRSSLIAFGFDDPFVFEEWEGGIAGPVAEYSYKFVVVSGSQSSPADPIGWIPCLLGVNSNLGGPLGITSSIDPPLVPYQVRTYVAQIRKWKFLSSVPLAIVHAFGVDLLGINTILGATVLGGASGTGVVTIPIHSNKLCGVCHLGIDSYLSGWTYTTKPS